MSIHNMSLLTSIKMSSTLKILHLCFSLEISLLIFNIFIFIISSKIIIWIKFQENWQKHEEDNVNPALVYTIFTENRPKTAHDMLVRFKIKTKMKRRRNLLYFLKVNPKLFDFQSRKWYVQRVKFSEALASTESQ